MFSLQLYTAIAVICVKLFGIGNDDDGRMVEHFWDHVLCEIFLLFGIVYTHICKTFKPKNQDEICTSIYHLHIYFYLNTFIQGVSFAHRMHYSQSHHHSHRHFTNAPGLLYEPSGVIETYIVYTFRFYSSIFFNFSTHTHTYEQRIRL